MISSILTRHQVDVPATPALDSPSQSTGRRWFGSDRKVNGISDGDGTAAQTDSNDPASSSLAASMAWRRSQIDKLEEKFATDDKDRDGTDDSVKIESDEELQPMWRDMESRVTKRRSLTAAQRKGKVGRRNIRKSDEDMWLESGLYDNGKGGENGKK